MTGLPVRSTIAGLAAGAALLLGGAAPAMAQNVASVTADGSGTTYTYKVSAEGASSSLTLSYENGDYVFSDPAVDGFFLSDSAQARCRVGPRPYVLRCPFQPLGKGMLSILLSGGGDDEVVIDKSVPRTYGVNGTGGGTSSLLINTYGGADTIRQLGPAVAAPLSGGDGYDTFVGGSGDDYFEGGAGNDSFNGGPGADTFNGGDGVDQTSYAGEGRTAGVRVALDGSLPSGAPGLWDGSGDRITRAEEVVGTPYTDVITGSAGDDYLFGEGGSDRIDGLGGNDEIWAPGGPSWVDGGDGNDTIHAKNSAKDFLSCGAGADTVFLDASETFVPFSACETLKP